MRHTEYAQVSSGANSPPKPRPIRLPSSFLKLFEMEAAKYQICSESIFDIWLPVPGQQPQHRGRPPRTNSLLPAAMQRGWSKQQGAAAACARLIGNGQTLACLLVCVCCCLTIGELAWHCIGAACRLPAPARKISFGPARSSRWLPASRTGVRNTEAVANSSLLQRSSRVARRSSSSSVPAASPAA